MLLSSVILVLEETLEVALLVSMLAAVSHRLNYGMTWLHWGLFGGLVLAVLYAVNMESIAVWFDYVGQEIVNAFAQITIAMILVLLPWTICSDHDHVDHGSRENRHSLLFHWGALIVLVLSIGREGSEIILYLDGFLQQEGKVQAVLVGGGIGFSIGISVAILLFYGLIELPRKLVIVIPVLLLALFAGNMLAQASQQLTQADWLPSTGTLWDTSGLIHENSISGQLLYALIGYESNPSLIQVIAYLAGTTLLLLVYSISQSTKPL